MNAFFYMGVAAFFYIVAAIINSASAASSELKLLSTALVIACIVFAAKVLAEVYRSLK